MGICLDTEANTAAAEADQPAAGGEWKGGGRQQQQLRGSNNPAGDPAGAPRSATLSMQHPSHAGKVKFEPPKVPVIFVLGGPGSGKVTHCDTLMQERKGIAHINMMDLLQQYAIGNDMQDFSQLSSKVVTEVLMLEIKMAPAAKAYLVSGFPRSMRDVVEYTEKIQVINGVVLISWRQTVLQKQIDYGVKLGHVVLSLAKMELDNFFKNVMPVADYYDQSNLLFAVNGERAPNEVYRDFRTAVLDILGSQENQEALLNGVAGMGKGANEIPGSIVSVDTAPSQPTQPTTHHRTQQQQHQQPPHDVINVITAAPTAAANRADADMLMMVPAHHSIMGQQTGQPAAPPIATTTVLSSGNHAAVNLRKLSPVICVIGGPGSNKSVLCTKLLAQLPGWAHFSVGRIVRTIAESDPKANTENHAIKEAIAAGEMIAKRSLDRLIEEQLVQLADRRGVIIDGLPRDVQQVRDFEEKYGQRPPIILLDCSKLQLGRGRMDDTVSSFRRRLELFRELTLPMLKTLDGDGRLTIVDGDTDSPSVQREFEKIVRDNAQQLIDKQTSANMTAIQHIGKLYNSDTANRQRQQQAAAAPNRRSGSGHRPRELTVQDMEEVPPPGVVPTISHHISLVNGGIGTKATAAGSSNNTATATAATTTLPNGIGAGRPSFRHMLDEADVAVDSYM